MKPHFFKTQLAFRKWLEKNHLAKSEIIVGFYKVNSGKPSMTWSESVDQALCFGWIDGVRRSVDEESYCIRFTPRRSSSVWSAINIQKVMDLQKQGLMLQVGMDAFNKRREDKSEIYSHETVEMKFSPDFVKLFKSNPKSWKFFQSLAPSYRKMSINWVMSAKRIETQTKRMKLLIAESEAGRNLWKISK